LRVGEQRVLIAIGCGAGAVLWMWWHDTRALHGSADWLTNAGRLCGLGAGYAVIVLVGLMARVPALERGIGTATLASWHGAGGRYAVWLSCAHAVLITAGYAQTAHSSLIAQAGSLLTDYPDVLKAAVALGLLIGVGVTSARAIRRRLAYESWHLLHLYTYLAIALAFGHQFATGAEFRTHPLSRWAWAGLYLSVAVVLIWYRLLTPLRSFRRHQLHVTKVERETPAVVSVHIAGRALDRLHIEPGQFFRWRFLTRDLWWASNPYSISAPPTDDHLRITVKNSGQHSAALARLRPGTRVLAEGPYGAFTAARREPGRKVLLLAGGVGITPLRALFETIPALPGELTLVYRARGERELLLRTELDDIAVRRGATVHYLLGSSRRGARDVFTTAQLTRLIPDLADHDVFLCGPESMMAAARAGLQEAGVSARHIHDESFAL
jgi:ferredoxin-NADP reductase